MIRFFTPFRLVLLVVLALAAVAGYVLVPPGVSLPVHWNIAGEPDLRLPREIALILPIAAAALVWLIFLGVDRFTRPDDRQAGAYVVGVVLSALTLMFGGIEIATVAIGLGLPVNMVQVVSVAVGMLLLVLGNAMPKSRPNSYAGIRMPTTLRSEANWLATHRLGGWLTIAGGIVLLVAAFTAPPWILSWFLIGCVLGPMLIASAYSIVIAHRAA